MAYGELAFVYDRLMVDMPYGEWVDWVVQHVPAQGAHIVDLGCGTGSVAIPLAERGYAVTGIDLSDTMLAVAAQKAERTSVQWLEQDMVEWSVGEPVDAVVCLCDGLNYLTEPDDFAQAIRQAASQLKPGGVLLFDLLPAGQLERYAAEQPYVHDESDLAYMWTCDWDASEQTIYHDITFFIQTPSGTYTRFEESHTERAYAKADVEQLLEQAGFTEVNWSSDFGRAPYSDAASRVFVSARLR